MTARTAVRTVSGEPLGWPNARAVEDLARHQHPDAFGGGASPAAGE